MLSVPINVMDPNMYGLAIQSYIIESIVVIYRNWTTTLLSIITKDLSPPLRIFGHGTHLMTLMYCYNKMLTISIQT